MNKHVQIRNLPEETHRKLKIRAAREGMSMSDYLRLEIEKLVSRPTMKEWLEIVRSHEPVALSREEIIASIHEGREENDAKIDRILAKKL
jgi:antitoxin FitA